MTPAVTALKRAKIAFQIHEYAHDPSARSYGLEAAEKLGLNPDQVFKTLVVSLEGRRLGVAVIPVNQSLNLKQFAKICGVRKATLAEPASAERATGYVMGGVSPLGQKKRLDTVIDQSAAEFDAVFVSGGRRGLDIEIAPQGLAKLTAATIATICA